MGENCKEIDLGDVFISNSISEFLKELSAMDDFSLKLAKLKAYIHVHEEELTKVCAFKRELPICMRLLKDVIERLKEEAEECEAREKGAAMEEFLPMKKTCNLSDLNDKKNWLSSAQLWTTPLHYEHFDLKSTEPFLHLQTREKGECSRARKNMMEMGVKRSGAFVPYKKCDYYSVKIEKGIVECDDDGLNLSMMQVNEMGCLDLSLREDDHGASGRKSQKKKQRRCWSRELHKRFVDALEQLGGAQAATPKQIREIMQEDGLTNDEVKSHLQKYRIHIRKLPSIPMAPLPRCKWVLQAEKLGDFSTTTSMAAQTDSPQGPLHLGGAARGAASTACAQSLEEEEEEEKSEILK